MTEPQWDNHYARERSRLSYPDENLVRLIRKDITSGAIDPSLPAVDLGCGSGRHLKLLGEHGFSAVIGTDNSFRALDLARGYSPLLIQSDNRSVALKSGSAGLVIAWGSLHYGRKEDLPPMVNEIRRILRPAGKLYATLRCEKDTFLKKGKHIGNDTWITDLDDIAGSTVSFYGENELKKIFSVFTLFRYGLAERSLVGDTGSIISHWVIQAGK